LDALGADHRVAVHVAANGMVVRAGDVPQIGDTNRQDPCDIYHVVGRALRDIRARGHPAFIADESGLAGDPERTERWLSSLDS
jgi:hypothetical protein